MPADTPDLLLIGPHEHGVVQYAQDVAAAVLSTGARTSVVHLPTADTSAPIAATRARMHLHVTDRILGRSPEEAAERLECLAAETRLTITMHDLPQESDGTGYGRRVAAYSRFARAADGVVVNSRHEQQLVVEHLRMAAETVTVIPIGTRTDRPLPTAVSAVASRRDDRHDALVVVLAGFIYPGKGHLEAIVAAAAAVARLRSTGEQPGGAAVVAIGGPSPGHEADVEVLRARAEESGVDLRVTGYLDATSYARETAAAGIPVAAHQHVSASRSMLDWVEQGRRPLVPDSRYSREMADLRPGTIALYDPADLTAALSHAWRHPESTRLPPGTDLNPTLASTARAYREWWRNFDAS